jgi:tRNA pseudouridine65 synthase
MELRILFQDDRIVAIHKPPGLLVHRTGISEDRVFVLQTLRNQLGRHVYPVHRLDRGTAGVLVFALDSDAAKRLQQSLDASDSLKTYLAIVRGWLPESGVIDSPLAKDGTGTLQMAKTNFTCLAKAELQIPVDRYATSRYSLAKISLETGRWRQIRRHFNHLRHPVLGDRKLGDRHHNRMWEEHFQLVGLQLLAWQLSFEHPFTGERLCLEAEPEQEMRSAFAVLGWDFPKKE